MGTIFSPEPVLYKYKNYVCGDQAELRRLSHFSLLVSKASPIFMHSYVSCVLSPVAEVVQSDG